MSGVDECRALILLGGVGNVLGLLDEEGGDGPGGLDGGRSTGTIGLDGERCGGVLDGEEL